MKDSTGIISQATGPFSDSADHQGGRVLLIGIGELASLLGCSRRHTERLDSSGMLPLAVRLGRLKKWRLAEIQSWVKAGCPCRQVWQTGKSRPWKD